MDKLLRLCDASPMVTINRLLMQRLKYIITKGIIPLTQLIGVITQSVTFRD